MEIELRNIRQAVVIAKKYEDIPFASAGKPQPRVFSTDEPLQEKFSSLCKEMENMHTKQR